MMNSREIDAAAAAWLARRDRGKWGENEREALEDWLAEATAHRVAYLRLISAWEKAERLQVLGAGLPAGRLPSKDAWDESPFFSEPGIGHFGELPVPIDAGAIGASQQFSSTVRHFSSKHALAAVVATAAIVTAAWFTIGNHPSSYATVKGGIEGIPLADGSRVTLSSDSEMRVAETEHERNVELSRGEAFFDVAKDPHRPFVVRAGHARIVAVGTKFSVRYNKDDVRVVVTEGKVRIEQAAGSNAFPETLLPAGSIAHSSGAGVVVQSKPLPEVEDVLSWRSGFLIFRNTPLRDAVAEFNRYSPRPIAIDDADIADLQISGSFRSTNVEGFLRLLHSGLSIRSEERAGAITLYGARATS